MTAFGEMLAFVLHILIKLRSLKIVLEKERRYSLSRGWGWRGKLKAGLGSVGGIGVFVEFLRRG